MRAVLAALLAGLCAIAAPAGAQSVAVRDAWVRGTVHGQKATGAFMELTSTAPARLVAAESPAARATEIHNMRMEGGVMRMYAVPAVELPANRTVKLAPGGFHVMLFDLRQPLKPGDRVPLKLTFELAGGKRESLDLAVEVRPLTAAHHPAH